VGRCRWPFLSSLPIALPLAATLLLGDVGSAKALVPYVFLPNPEELNGAGVEIALVATRLLRLGQVEDAARFAELTVRLLPEDPRGWVLLAEAQLRSNHTDKALLALSRAKQLDPNNPGIWFAEGSLALRDGKPEAAIGLLRKGLALDSKNAGAYFDLGNAQILLNDPGTALGSFERAARLRKDFWEAINNQGLVLFEINKPNEALLRWKQVLKIKPDVPETTLALAAGLFEANPQNRSEALRLAESALDAEPNYVLDSFQKEQLWGDKLRKATRQLLAQPELKPAVERATSNATGRSETNSGKETEE
jgi:tetratricopeptide (TPR) repeat protein